MKLMIDFRLSFFYKCLKDTDIFVKININFYLNRNRFILIIILINNDFNHHLNFNDLYVEYFDAVVLIFRYFRHMVYLY